MSAQMSCLLSERLLGSNGPVKHKFSSFHLPLVSLSVFNETRASAPSIEKGQMAGKLSSGCLIQPQYLSNEKASYIRGPFKRAGRNELAIDKFAARACSTQHVSSLPILSHCGLCDLFS